MIFQNATSKGQRFVAESLNAILDRFGWRFAAESDDPDLLATRRQDGYWRRRRRGPTIPANPMNTMDPGAGMSTLVPA